MLGLRSTAEPSARQEGSCRDIEVVAVGIDALNLSVRSRNVLREAGILTVGDLVSQSEVSLLRLKNGGRKFLVEVSEKLRAVGLELASAKGDCAKVECACGCGALIPIKPRYAAAACRQRASLARGSDSFGRGGAGPERGDCDVPGSAGSAMKGET